MPAGRNEFTTVAKLFASEAGREYNAVDFGAVGDGVTDDTGALQNAINVVAAANGGAGGRLRIPGGLYSVTGLALLSNVYIEGDGIGATTIKLASGANTDLLSAYTASINIGAAGGGGSSVGVFNWGLADLTLDGNYTAQTAGPSWCLRFYGYGYILQNLEIKNGYTGCVQADYNGNYPANWMMEPRWLNLHIHHAMGISTSIGVEFGGPTDSRWTNVEVYECQSHGVHFGVHASGPQLANCHFWQTGLGDNNSATLFLENQWGLAVDVECAESPTAIVALLNSDWTWFGGSIMGGSNGQYYVLGAGLQIGQQAGNTPFTNTSPALQSGGLTLLASPHTNFFATTLVEIANNNGGLYLASDGGGNVFQFTLRSPSTGTYPLITGTPSPTSHIKLVQKTYPAGTPTGITVQPGVFAIGSPVGGFVDPGNAGTIATNINTVMLVKPASASETGWILQAGQYGGQLCVVVNLSPVYTGTFDVAGTSHVADGTSDVIAVLTARMFVWDTTSSLWHRCA